MTGGVGMSHLNPGRRQPYRLGEPRYEELWQPVAFCCSVHQRRPLLLADDVPRVLTDTLLEAAAQHGSAVIAYCIVPDHVHYLACVVEKGGNLRSMIEWFKRVSARRISGIGFNAPIWQRSYWDRHLRPHEKTSQAVDYILDNPVRKGLCRNRDDWEHSGFFGYPWDAIDEDSRKNG